MARRLTLNPVLIILSLIFWFWMWGIAGAFLAVPVLAVLKIVCDRIEPLMAIGHFLGGEAPIVISPSSPPPATSHTTVRWHAFATVANWGPFRSNFGRALISTKRRSNGAV
jgi:hypothetical protein